MTDIAGKTAFITGGASGLGFATARALAAKGASVILADIDANGVEEAAAMLRGEGANALGIQLDVTSEDGWASAGEKARDFGPVRILFSNAGVGGGSGPFEHYDTDVWRWNYAVNAHAHLYACRTFLGDMKASGEPSPPRRHVIDGRDRAAADFGRLHQLQRMRRRASRWRCATSWPTPASISRC